MIKNSKGKRNHGKKLRRGKKIEATKPLDVPVHTATSSGGDRPTESVSLNFTKISF